MGQTGRLCAFPRWNARPALDERNELRKMADDRNLYEQLVDIITQQIKNNEYKVGDPIPSERKLCETYDMSRSTVRKAIEELEKRGYVERKYGSGTYISRQTVNTQLSSFYSFSSEMKRLGYNFKSPIIGFQITPCPEWVRHQLEIQPGQDVFQIKRLRVVNDEPMIVETSYVPVSYCPTLSAGIIEDKGLYNALTLLSDIVINAAQETFEAVIPNNEVRHLLSITTQAPILRLDRLAYAEGRIIEYCESFVRGDRYKYSIFLK